MTLSRTLCLLLGLLNATDPRGNVYYEPSRCVFLYRLQ
jgi:hypothetical protein